MASEQHYCGKVDKVVAKGNHGPYAVARNDELGLVTFSLDPPVWQEGEYPENGTIVILSNIQKKSAGWRAKSGRFFRPSDEQRVQTEGSK